MERSNIQNIQNQKNRLLPLKEISRIYKYTEQHLGLLCRQGKLKARRIGKRWYTTKNWMDEYLKDLADTYKKSQKVQLNSEDIQNIQKTEFEDEWEKLLFESESLEKFSNSGSNSGGFQKELQKRLKKLLGKDLRLNVWQFNLVNLVKKYGLKTALAVTAFALVIFFSLSPASADLRTSLFKNFAQGIHLVKESIKDGVKENVLKIQEGALAVQKGTREVTEVYQGLFLKTGSEIVSASSFLFNAPDRILNTSQSLSKSFSQSFVSSVDSLVQRSKSLSQKSVRYFTSFSLPSPSSFSSALSSSFSDLSFQTQSFVQKTKSNFRSFINNLLSLPEELKKIPQKLADLIIPSQPPAKFSPAGGSSQIRPVKEKISLEPSSTISRPVRSINQQPSNLYQEIRSIKAELASIKQSGIKIQQNVIERRIERIISGVSQKDLQTSLDELNQSILSQIKELKAELIKKTRNNYNSIALTQRVDRLYTPTISSPTITRPTISGNASLETLTTSGRIEIGGNTFLNADTRIGDEDSDLLNIRSGNWAFSSTATTTVTMVNGLNFDSGTFVIDPNSGRVGIATASPAYELDIQGDVRATGSLIVSGQTINGNLSIADNTTLGNATSSDILFLNSRIADSLVPTTDNLLDLGSGTDWLRWRTGYFGTSVAIAGTATSTGSELTASGAYLINSGSTLSINTTDNQPIVFGQGNVTIPALVNIDSGTLYVASSTDRVGIGTTSPPAIGNNKLTVGGDIIVTLGNGVIWADGAVQGTNNQIYFAGSGSALDFHIKAGGESNRLVLKGDTGNVGIGTSSPFAKLSVAGDAYFDGALTASTFFATSSISAPYFTATDSSATSTFAGGFSSASSLYVLQNGNVGIGTTSPVAKLSVNGSTALAGGMSVGSSYAGQSVTDGNVIISGNVGIGTTAPVSKLNVYGTADIKVTASSPGYGFKVYNAGNTIPYVEITRGSGTPNFGLISLYSDSSEKVRLSAGGNSYFNSGNVGIGTTGPGAKLEIVGTSNTAATKIGAPVVAGEWTGILLGRSGAGKKAGIFFENAGVGYYRGNLHFATNNSEIDTEDATLSDSRMTITYDGNVGIGTTGPEAKLDVSGGYIALDNGYGLAIRDTGGVSRYVIKLTASNNTEIDAPSGGDIFFWTPSAGEIMRLKSNGNVGIGTTSPGAKLEVHGGDIKLSGNGVGILQGSYTRFRDLPAALGSELYGSAWTYNVVYDSVDARWESITGGRGSAITAEEGKFAFYNTNTFTGAGEAVTWTNRFFINSSGNVGIGTTAPGYKLVVKGDKGEVRAVGGTTGDPDRLLFLQQLTADTPASILLTGKNAAGTDQHVLLSASNDSKFHIYTPGQYQYTGTKALTIDNSGNVGIGTTSPAKQLTVSNSDDAWFALERTGNATNQKMGGMKLTSSGIHIGRIADVGSMSDAIFIGPYGTADNVAIGGDTSPDATLEVVGTMMVSSASANDGDRFIVKNDGNVGIGTTGPVNNLEIIGNGDSGQAISGWALGVRGITDIDVSDNSNPALQVRQYGTGNILTLKDSNSKVLVVKDGGNVGIGTTGPEGPLHVFNNDGGSIFQRDGSARAIVSRREVSTAGNSTGITFQLLDSASNLDEYAYVLGGIVDSTGGSEKGFLAFGTRNGVSAAVERVRIDENGNVGIGTTGPEALLHLNTPSGGNVKLLMTEVNPNGRGAQLEAWEDAGGGGNFRIMTHDTSGVLQERMRITSNGNVGIGTTGPGYKLVVSGGDIGFDAADRSIRRGLERMLTFEATALVINEDGNPDDFRVEGDTDPYLIFADASEEAVGIGYSSLTGATGKLLINGNVGIGTTGPVNNLEIIGNGDSGQAISGWALGVRGITDIDVSDNSNPALQVRQYGTGNILTLKDSNSKVLVVKDGGNVGIGTTSPSQKLEVVDAVNPRVFFTDTTNNVTGQLGATDSFAWTGSYTNHDFRIRTNDNDRVTITNTGNVGIGTTSPTAKLAVGSGSALASIEVPYGGICVDNDGGCTASTTGRISAVDYTTGSTDLAEMYYSEQSLEPGDIVMTTGKETIAKAQKAQEMAVIGVISTKPGIILGLDNDNYPEENTYPVALAGRVLVKVTLEGGEIKPGDRISLSHFFEGIGKKAEPGEQFVGIALEEFNKNSSPEFLLSTQNILDLQQLSPEIREKFSQEFEREINQGAVKIGKVLVLINLGYPNLNKEISSLNSNSNNPLWIKDSGKIVYSAGLSLDLDNQSLSNVKSIVSSSGNWSISEDGTLSVKRIETESIRIGSSESPKGVEMYDFETKQLVCVFVQGGKLRSVPGPCSFTSLSGEETSDIEAGVENNGNRENEENRTVETDSSNGSNEINSGGSGNELEPALGEPASSSSLEFLDETSSPTLTSTSTSASTPTSTPTSAEDLISTSSPSVLESISTSTPTSTSTSTPTSISTSTPTSISDNKISLEATTTIEEETSRELVSGN